MPELTTRQRDLLAILLEAENPLGAAELAARTHLTARQVSYSLEGVNIWLSKRQAKLNITPGVGVVLQCSPRQHKNILAELSTSSTMQLVLSAGERQQLLALVLLSDVRPQILHYFKQILRVSRTTAIKDIDAIAGWLQRFDLTVARKPNYGIWIEGLEQDRRQALAGLFWGETPFGESLYRISYSAGLEFLLASDAELLPILRKAGEVIRQFEIQRTFRQVAYAEAQLGGRFTDDSVLYLSISLAIQSARINDGHAIEQQDNGLAWLRTTQVWPVAQQIAARLGWRSSTGWPENEIGLICKQLLAAPRNERWPGDLELDTAYSRLVEVLLERIAEAYALPGLREDPTLRDGIVNQIIPACLRQRFHLWAPSPPETVALSEKYTSEHRLAHELAALIDQQARVNLPESEINNLALLLRAAYIRERPRRMRQVFVVCPSGMATAQLLVARLRAHFPRIGPLKVVSVRELTEETPEAPELIITTIPLPTGILNRYAVIQVHPLLLPEDIETITDYMS